jgi:hypothetical protein
MLNNLAVIAFGLLLGWVITCIIVLIAPEEEENGADNWP